MKPSLFGNRQMCGGLLMFFVLYLVQAGMFFTIPLFLSVSLGLSALETGVRILPLSITLLAAAVGIPRFLPQRLPANVVRLGLLAMFGGVSVLMSAIDPSADARIVTIPAAARRAWGSARSCLAAGRGHRVRGTRRAQPRGGRPAEHRNEPRRRHRHRARGFPADHRADDVIPAEASRPTRRSRNRSSRRRTSSSPVGLPSSPMSTLQNALTQAGVDPAVTQAALDANRQARVDGLRSALAVLALIALLGLFVARPGARPPPARGGRRSAERDRTAGRTGRGGCGRRRVTDPPGRRRPDDGHALAAIPPTVVSAGGMPVIVVQSRRSRRRAVRLAVRRATLRDPNMATSSSSVLIVRVRSTRTPSRDRASRRPPRPRPARSR